jgi:PAS domain S-box-containing protein
LPRSAFRFIALTALAGLVSLAGVAAIAGDEGFGPLVGTSVLSLLLAVKWLFPILLYREGDNVELITLDEAFIIVAILLLPPLGAVSAVALSAAVGPVLMRRPAIRIVFNVAQYTVATTAAVTVARVLGGGGDFGPRRLAAGAAAGAVFFFVNSGAVSGIVALVEGRRLRDVWRDGAVVRVVTTTSGIAIGLMAVLAESVHSWALVFAIAPMLALHAISQSHVRARRDRQRAQALLEVALDAQKSIGVGTASAICESARRHLRCREARIDHAAPRAGELGTRFFDEGHSRWLIVSRRLGDEPFTVGDQRLLDAIATTTATALANAVLYDQVAAERKKMTDVVASSSDGILSVDADQRIQSWNPAMARITGIPADEAIGTRSVLVFRPRDEQGNELAGTGVLGGGEPVNVQITTIANEQKWLTCTYSPLPDGGYVVVARDITTQKQVDDLKADFLATVSHELRTPLTPIQGFLHTLMREDVTFEDDQRRRFYEVMLRQSERLERLVKDLLDATSLQDSQQLFLPEEVDWASSVAHTVELFRTQEPARDFVLEIEQALPHVVADEQRAEQILSNLINNAIKYSGETQPVRITVEEIDGQIRTTVFDHGPGVPPGDRDRIFERFTRLGDHLTRKVGGAGLGLFIAKRLAEGMGGDISVDDSPDGGAAFSFTLPPYAGARTIQL